MIRNNKFTNPLDSLEIDDDNMLSSKNEIYENDRSPNLSTKKYRSQATNEVWRSTPRTNSKEKENKKNRTVNLEDMQCISDILEFASSYQIDILEVSELIYNCADAENNRYEKSISDERNNISCHKFLINAKLKNGLKIFISKDISSDDCLEGSKIFQGEICLSEYVGRILSQYTSDVGGIVYIDDKSNLFVKETKQSDIVEYKPVNASKKKSEKETFRLILNWNSFPELDQNVTEMTIHEFCNNVQGYYSEVLNVEMLKYLSVFENFFEDIQFLTEYSRINSESFMSSLEQVFKYFTDTHQGKYSTEEQMNRNENLRSDLSDIKCEIFEKTSGIRAISKIVEKLRDGTFEERHSSHSQVSLSEKSMSRSKEERLEERSRENSKKSKTPKHSEEVRTPVFSLKNNQSKKSSKSLDEMINEM